MVADDHVGQAQQHQYRPLPSIGDARKQAQVESNPEDRDLHGGLSKSNKSNKSNKSTHNENERKRNRGRGDVSGTILGPREMNPGHNTASATGRASDEARDSTKTNNTFSKANVTGEKNLAVKEQDTAVPQSFSHKAAQLNRSPTPLLVQGDHRLLRDIDRAPPGDAPILRSRRKSLLSLTGSKRESNNTDGGANGGSANRRNSRVLSESLAAFAAGEYSELARKRSQYFEDIFSARDGDNSPAKERVRSESLVLAEIRTNVHVADEFTLLTELSAHLASRYSRPLSSIVVTLQHGQCMCFGGSFESAYIMCISALPSQLQPTTNKRNAALIQKHMEEALGVPATRGHLQFTSIPETNLAYGGNTTVGHLDDLARSGSIHGAVAGTGASYGKPGGLSSNGGMRGDSTSKPPAIAVADGQPQIIGSGLGSRKYKTARKLSVKNISSGFRSSTPSPEKAAAAASPQGPPKDSYVTSGEHTICAQSQISSTAAAAAAAAPPSSALPMIPERLLKESQQGEEGNGGNGGEESQGHTSQKLYQDKTGGGIGVHELPTQVSTPHPNGTGFAAATGQPQPAVPAEVGRQPSQRARRTKSFMASFFGRSVSASAATPAKIQEEVAAP